jgi:CHAD domain-containing protein
LPADATPQATQLIDAAAQSAPAPVSGEITVTAAVEEPARQRRLRLERLLRRGVKKFIGALPKVLADQDREAVHDLRVWSRRLQQVIATLHGPQPSNRARTVRAILKRTRRALGAWRNLDVAIETLDRLERRARDAERKRAWTLVREAAVAERKRAVKRARKRLMRLDVFGLSEAVEGLLRASDEDLVAVADQPFWTALNAAFEKWRQALAAALESMQPERVHTLRLCTKRLRYRIEIARELGVAGTDETLAWCKHLQEELGRWHDRLELQRIIAHRLADPDLLMTEPRIGIILLTELDRMQRLATRSMHRELEAIAQGPAIARCESWLRENGAVQPARDATDQSDTA